MKKLTLLLLIGALVQPVFAHRFFESLSSLNINQKNGNLEIIHRITAHDMLIILSETKKINLTYDTPNFEQMVRQYVEHHFVLMSENRRLNTQWVGLEIEQAQVLVYQEVSGNISLNNLQVENALLLPFFSKQVNRVNYRSGQVTGTLIFSQQQTKHTITL